VRRGWLERQFFRYLGHARSAFAGFPEQLYDRDRAIKKLGSGCLVAGSRHSISLAL
jgi:hypothetical protein